MTVMAGLSGLHAAWRASLQGRAGLVACALGAMLALSGPALAHPHVFIDAALGLDYDRAGRLAEIEVEWRYDAFYSLLILEDHGIRPGLGGQLSDGDRDRLRGFDGDWDPGFDGSLRLEAGGRPVALAGPRDFDVALEGGQIVSRHRRPLAQPLDAEQSLIIRVYDPEFYVDFSVPSAPATRGRDDCQVALRPGDSYAAADAYANALRDALARELARYSGMTEEMLTVDIGSVGAPEMRVQCGAAG